MRAYFKPPSTTNIDVKESLCAYYTSHSTQTTNLYPSFENKWIKHCVARQKIKS